MWIDLKKWTIHETAKRKTFINYWYIALARSSQPEWIPGL